MSMPAIKAQHYTNQFQSLRDNNEITSSLIQKFDFYKKLPRMMKAYM